MNEQMMKNDYFIPEMISHFRELMQEAEELRTVLQAQLEEKEREAQRSEEVIGKCCIFSGSDLSPHYFFLLLLLLSSP
jgi:hypothetical protein